MEMTSLLSDQTMMGPDRLYLLELKQWTNNYRGSNLLGAVYAQTQIDIGKLHIQTGIRAEHNDMALITHTRDDRPDETTRHYRSTDLFPAIAATWRWNDRHQARLSYGRSINRPEFREIASAVYYDFDLASNVQGNAGLKDCHVDNLDFRYEWYPSPTEMVSLAFFYKHFKSPIEWTYTVAGGTDLVYSYTNAGSADNFGIELEMRKKLDFIGLKDFTWSLNAAVIDSRVVFGDDVRDKDRPMQGQSPYLINTGLFYRNTRHDLTLSVLYNRIGKRLVGVGRTEGAAGEHEQARVPDSYEMPRNLIDLALTKKWGEHWELRASVRDLLAEPVVYRQTAEITRNGGTQEIHETTRRFRPGRNFGLQVTYIF